MSTRRENCKGTIIVFVVVIIGIIGLLYSSLYIFLGIERKIHQSLEYRTKAYYIAESGLERGVAIIKNEDDFAPFFEFTLTDPFSSEYKVHHKVRVYYTALPGDIYRIRADGEYGGTKRSLEAEVLKTEDYFSIQSWKEVS